MIGLRLITFLALFAAPYYPVETKSAKQLKPGKERIIGGQSAAIEEYPFAVSLQNNGTFYGYDVEHFCGGSIIADSWIITSAQCALSVTVRKYHVRAGATYYYKGGTIYEVDDVVVHPDFNYGNYECDVGLVKLKNKIIFDSAKKPIKLPRKDTAIADGAEVGVVGWGSTRILGPYSETLKDGVVSKISNEECRSEYNYQLTDQMFCVISNDESPCVGDSGSSAVINGILIGVASWSESCAFTYPTAYSNVPRVMDWITEISGVS